MFQYWLLPERMKAKIALVLILIMAIFMRFYRLPQLLHWTMDEEFWSYLPFNIASGYHFPLIGGHIAGTGLYSGPLFIYLMAIPAKIFSGNPIGFGITVSAIGVLASGLIFIAAQKMFDLRTGLLAAALYAGSFLIAIFDRHYWNASLTPALAILVLYFLYRMIKAREYIFALPLALVLALAFHAHGTGMALLLFTLLSWPIFRLPIFEKKIILALALFLAFQLPLVFFDLRHDFLNSRSLVSYLTTSHGGSIPLPARMGNIITGFYSAGSRLIYFPAKDLAIEQTLGLPQSELARREKAPLPAQLTFVALLVFTVLEKKRSLGQNLSLMLIGATLVGLLIYKEKVPEYFFSPTFVPLLLLLARQLSRLFSRRLGRIAVLVFLALFTLFNLRNITVVEHSSAYLPKLAAVEKAITLAGDQPFVFNAQCRGNCQLYGFRYLFTYLRREPVQSYMDTYFSWLYENRLSKMPPTREVDFEINGDLINVNVQEI